MQRSGSTNASRRSTLEIASELGQSAGDQTLVDRADDAGAGLGQIAKRAVPHADLVRAGLGTEAFGGEEIHDVASRIRCTHAYVRGRAPHEVAPPGVTRLDRQVDPALSFDSVPVKIVASRR